MDTLEGIALDSVGNAYVAGWTNFPDYPTTPDALDHSLSGNSDAFITKLDVTGSELAYSTFFGGKNSDHAAGIAVDSWSNIFVVGQTNSFDLPTTIGAFGQSQNGSVDMFVLKLSLPQWSLENDATGDQLIKPSSHPSVNTD